jgi:hypothetical protein
VVSGANTTSAYSMQRHSEWLDEGAGEVIDGVRQWNEALGGDGDELCQRTV